MPERKRVNELPNLDASNSEELPLEDEGITLGSGYSLALDNTKETTVIRVKTYGEVDSILLRRKLEQHYPGAKIEGLTSNLSVEVGAKGKPKSNRRKSKKQL